MHQGRSAVRQPQHRAWRAAAVTVVIAALVALTGCSSSGSSTSSSSTGGTSSTAGTSGAAAKFGVPARIISAKTMTWCIDLTYPPEDYLTSDSKPTGSDVDITDYIAKQWGIKHKIINVSGPGIIAALQAGKCQVVICGCNEKPERAKVVEYVPYLKVGQGLLVKKGNPKGIHTLADLSGKSVAVQLSTTNQDALKAENAVLSKQGKPQIKIAAYADDTDAFQQLKIGRVDAYSGDSPVCAYYQSKSPSDFELGGTPIKPILVVMFVPKGQTDLQGALIKTVKAMYGDGTMKTILDKYKMTQSVVPLYPL